MTTPAPGPSGSVPLAVAAVAGALPSLDTSVNIALPAISDAFSLGVGDVSWVVVGYVLTYAALLLGCGRLADRMGHRRVLVSGLVVNTLAFGLCALAPTFPLLVAARVVQGAGAGLVLASAPALVTLAVAPDEQSRALGVFQSCVWAAFAVGPPVGGLVLGAGGWPAVWSYRVAVGLGLLAVVLVAVRGRTAPAARAAPAAGAAPTGPGAPAARAAPAAPPPRPAAQAPSSSSAAPATSPSAVPLDLAGGSTLALALVGLLLAASRGRALGWSSPTVLGAVSVGVLAAAVFVVVERRARAPVVDLALFARPGFAVANALNLAANASAFVILLLVPYYLVDVRGLGPVAGGCVLAAAPLGTAGCALLSGRLVGRVGVGPLSATGLALEAIGLAAVSRLGATSALVAVVAALVVAGMGLGLFQTPNQSFVMGSIPRAAQGVAGGMTQAVRTIGVLVGVAGAGTLLDVRQTARAERLGVPVDDPGAFVSAFRDVFLAAAVVAGVAAFVALARSSRAVATRPT